MKKKGFTISELITVIALLSIVMVVTIPRINSSIKESRADQLEEVRKMVANATEVYLDTKCGMDAYNNLIENNEIIIYLNSMSECGLIESKIYNPIADNYFDINNEYIIVRIDEVGFKDYELSF